MITSKMHSGSRHVRTHSLTGVSNLFAEMTSFSKLMQFLRSPTHHVVTHLDRNILCPSNNAVFPPSSLEVWLFKWKSDMPLLIRVTESRFIHLLHAHQLQGWMHDLDLPQWSETHIKMHRLVRVFSHGADGHLGEEEAAREQWWERGTGGGMPASTDCFLCRATWVAGFRQWHCPPSRLHRNTNRSWPAGGLGPGWPLHTNKQP